MVNCSVKQNTDANTMNNFYSTVHFKFQHGILIKM